MATVGGLRAACRTRPHSFCECSPSCRRPRRRGRATARAPSQNAPTPRGAVLEGSALRNRKATLDLKSAHRESDEVSIGFGVWRMREREREEQQLSPLRIKIRVIEGRGAEKRLMVSRRNDRVWGH
jgi:hypothetical protein